MMSHMMFVSFVVVRLFTVTRRFIGTSCVQNVALVRARVIARAGLCQSLLARVFADITKLLLCKSGIQLLLTNTLC